MLTDSTSPQNDLDKLCLWLQAAETQEVLKYLRDKAEEAQSMALASPLRYDRSLDSGKIETQRHQFIGERRGLAELSRILKEREEELREKLKPKQDEQ